jgi:hypothetical protein
MTPFAQFQEALRHAGVSRPERPRRTPATPARRTSSAPDRAPEPRRLERAARTQPDTKGQMSRCVPAAQASRTGDNALQANGARLPMRGRPSPRRTPQIRVHETAALSTELRGQPAHDRARVEGITGSGPR